MEMPMEMEDEEEMEEQLIFEAREVDIDYEFDAAMVFDFTREESPEEARQAERWFDTAPSCPPSPFVAKLVSREENVGTLMGDYYKCGSNGSEAPQIELNNKECGTACKGVFSNSQEVSSKPLELVTAAMINYNHGMYKAKVKPVVKPNLPKSSTLMKPTASVLAKQNRRIQVDGSRFQLPFEPRDKSVCSSSAVENQAAKRQKLEGGHSCKVGNAKQQVEFIHKAPKKEATVDKSTILSRLRLTIPREPDLETAHRAQRMRPKNNTEVAHVAMAAQRFKARPLNRKILETPSLPLPKKSTPKPPEFQEFRLKTLERAMQHTSAVSSSARNHSEKGFDKASIISGTEIRKKEPQRPSALDAQRHDGCTAPHVFRARPLNNKIFTSKGDLGVFRNNKRETTVPTEFNFQTEKRIHHAPPVDLFSKLSLTSELQRTEVYRLQFPRPSFMSMKGLKENRLNDLQTEHKSSIEKPLIFCEKQIQPSGVDNRMGMRYATELRSLGVR